MNNIEQLCRAKKKLFHHKIKYKLNQIFKKKKKKKKEPFYIGFYNNPSYKYISHQNLMCIVTKSSWNETLFKKKGNFRNKATRKN